MNIEIDHSNPLPLHVQVENLLRQMIEQPEYKNGEFLPRETDLAKKLGISRNTLRQATNKLQYEGLLIRKKGVGSKVAQRKIATGLDDWHRFTREMNDKGEFHTNYKLRTEWVKAEEMIAGFFEIPAGTLILQLNRLRGDKDGPFFYMEHYFHPRTGLNEEDDFTRPLYEIQEKDYYLRPTVSNERITARLASPVTAERLGIKPGEPVLVRERFVLDPGSRPLEYNIGFYIADKYTYTISVKREK